MLTFVDLFLKQINYETMTVVDEDTILLHRLKTTMKLNNLSIICRFRIS